MFPTFKWQALSMATGTNLTILSAVASSPQSKIVLGSDNPALSNNPSINIYKVSLLDSSSASVGSSGTSFNPKIYLTKTIASAPP